MSIVAFKTQEFFDQERVSLFCELADKISAIAAKYDVTIVGYRSRALPIFSAQPPEKQKVALQHLSTYLATIQAAEAAGDRLDSQDRSVWHALSTLHLVPPAELFTQFKPDTAIEIYDIDNFQIWRNFTCMRYCSYTLEEIYSIDVFSRYHRDPEKFVECVGKVGELLAGRTPDVYNPAIGAHILRETLSQDKLILEVDHEIFCTLKNHEGKIAAWLVMSSAKLLGKEKVAESRQKVSLIRPSLVTDNPTL